MTMAEPLDCTSVLAAIRACWRAYGQGCPSFFDAFTEDVTVFSSTHPFRIDGLASYREHLEPVLAAARRSIQVFAAEVVAQAEGALVSYQCRIRVRGDSADQRVTTFVVATPAGPKIRHMHFSHLVLPRASDPPDLVEEITQIEPRTA